MHVLVCVWLSEGRSRWDDQRVGLDEQPRRAPLGGARRARHAEAARSGRSQATKSRPQRLQRRRHQNIQQPTQGKKKLFKWI